MFLLGFTSPDIILFAQIFRTSTLTEKKDFRHEFSFLTDRLNPPQPPERSKSAKCDKSFLSMLRNMKF